jgi:hypothetical protein
MIVPHGLNDGGTIIGAFNSVALTYYPTPRITCHEYTLAARLILENRVLKVSKLRAELKVVATWFDNLLCAVTDSCPFTNKFCFLPIDPVVDSPSNPANSQLSFKTTYRRHL